MKYKQIPKIELFFKELTHVVENDPERASNLLQEIVRMVHVTLQGLHSSNVEEMLEELFSEDEFTEFMTNLKQGGEA